MNFTSTFITSYLSTWNKPYLSTLFDYANWFIFLISNFLPALAHWLHIGRKLFFVTRHDQIWNFHLQLQRWRGTSQALCWLLCWFKHASNIVFCTSYIIRKNQCRVLWMLWNVSKFINIVVNCVKNNNDGIFLYLRTYSFTFSLC